MSAHDLPDAKPRRPRQAVWCFLITGLLWLPGAGCRAPQPDPSAILPRTLSDVPAQRLAYRFDADTAAPPLAVEGEETAWPAVQSDFDARRKDDALLRTVVSPDSQRVLALYATSELPEGVFRIDLYSADGIFLRNLTAPELACAFLPTVAWSPDGQLIAFIARQNVASLTPTPQPTPSAPDSTPAPPLEPGAAATDQAAQPTPTVGPLFAPVPVYSTEQIYVCDRDGFNLRPLTGRDGLIYFRFTWAPPGVAPALVALACKEDEWQARIAEGLVPAGRPRLLLIDGRERLLDDRLSEVVPVWSPDAAKVASAFGNEIAIYDAVVEQGAGARVPLREPLLAASARYDEANLKTEPTPAPGAEGQPKAEPIPTSTAAPGAEEAAPLSFNPIIRLEWTRPETLLAQTGFLRVYDRETISNYLRWHTLHLSPQAALMKPQT